MDKQLVAERLSDKYGVRVSVGLHKWIEDVRDEEGVLIRQILRDEGEKFTRIDDVPISTSDIETAMREVLQQYPSGRKPTEKTDHQEIEDIKRRLDQLEKKP